MMDIVMIVNQNLSLMASILTVEVDTRAKTMRVALARRLEHVNIASSRNICICVKASGNGEISSRHIDNGMTSVCRASSATMRLDNIMLIRDLLRGSPLMSSKWTMYMFRKFPNT